MVSCRFCCCLFWKCMRFCCCLFVSFCCMHLHFVLFIAVSNHCEICQMFFYSCFIGVSEMSEFLDLT